MQARLRALENENRALKQAAKAGTDSSARQRIQQLEAENAILKKNAGSSTVGSSQASGQDQMMKDRLVLLAKENRQLQDKVNRLKAGNLALSGESHTARQAFRDRKMAARRILLAKTKVAEME